MSDEFIGKVFAVVDSGDAAAFSKLFSDDGRMVFGNMEPMTGPAEIEAGVAGFFGTIKSLSHDIVNDWVVGDDSIAELSVTYHRLDDRLVTIPVVSRWHRAPDGLIDDYRVFFDLAPVFAA